MESEFISLIGEHRSLMMHAYNTYASVLDENETVQEIMLQAWKSFPSFRNESKFSTWFYTLCRNVCIGLLRKRAAMPVIVPISGDIPDIPYTDDIANKKLLEWRYGMVMNSLHPIERKYFALYLRGTSFKEIQRITGVDENTMRVRIHRIKEKLTKKFEKVYS